MIFKPAEFPDVSLTLPTIQFGVMGLPNHGKSELLATMEYPLLVIAADPYSKMQTFFEKGNLDPEVHKGQFGQPVYLVRSFKTNKVIIQVEVFVDPNPNIPWAFQAILSRLEQVLIEVNQGSMWKSVALDSWSQLEYVSKVRRTYGPLSIGVDSIPAAVKDDCEQIIKSRLVSLNCNVGVSLHINTKMIDAGGGTMLYEPIATGTLKSGIGSVLGEMYRCYATPDGTKPGGVRYNLQTKPDGRFECGTRIDAPNGCENKFPALFTNWINRRVQIIREQRAQEQAAAVAPTTESST